MGERSYIPESWPLLKRGGPSNYLGHTTGHDTWRLGDAEKYLAEEDIYTEEEQYADWVDKMIRAAEAEGGEVERSDRS